MNTTTTMTYILYTMLMLIACQHPSASDGHANQITTDSTSVIGNNQKLNNMKLPPGFKISYYAEDVKNARSLEMSPSGILYVGTRDNGNVYALKDENGDGAADKRWTLATGLQMPNGVAFKDGDLYVAEVSRIWKFPAIESRLDKPVKELFFDKYPDKTHHGWKYIAFGPDGNLYVPVGAPCNICESEDEVFATITRINMDSKHMEIVQRGIRNTVGFTWHPETGKLWFTDNGGDWLGEDMPACELNYAPADGLHYGYPYCHQGDFPDPKLGKKRNCSEFIPPVQKLGAHVAPLGCEFYTGTMFPQEYKNVLFIAEHGSWNRTKPSGYQLSMVRVNGDHVISHSIFAEGWLKDGAAWGRPVDIELLIDGSMLVSDDHGNAIYRITYTGD
jgi:glucose/arabinose dehydrogenase